MSRRLPKSSGPMGSGIACRGVRLCFVPPHRLSELLQNCRLIVGCLEGDLGGPAQLLGCQPGVLGEFPGLLAHGSELLVCLPQILGGGPSGFRPSPEVLALAAA